MNEHTHAIKPNNIVCESFNEKPTHSDIYTKQRASYQRGVCQRVYETALPFLPTHKQQHTQNCDVFFPFFLLTNLFFFVGIILCAYNSFVEYINSLAQKRKYERLALLSIILSRKGSQTKAENPTPPDMKKTPLKLWKEYDTKRPQKAL